MKCPKCGVQMSMIREIEQTNRQEKGIKVYYRCPLCNYKVLTEEIHLDFSNGTIKIMVKPALRASFIK